MKQNDQVNEPKPNVMQRFRRLPGARTAAAAFVLTVALGLGGPAAYAWWSQQGNATITVTAGKPAPGPVVPPTPTPTPTPTSPPTTPPVTPPPTSPPVTTPASPVAPTSLTCSRKPGKGGNGGRETTISWAAKGAPKGTSTVVEIVLMSKNGHAATGSRSYAVPGASGTVALAALPGIEDFLSDTHGRNTKFTVSVSNAWLNSAVSKPTPLGGRVSVVGLPSAPLTSSGFQYKEKGDWFNCPQGTH